MFGHELILTEDEVKKLLQEAYKKGYNNSNEESNIDQVSWETANDIINQFKAR